jgi:hypothetical protein
MNNHRSTSWRIGILLGASGLLWGCADKQDPELSASGEQSPEVTLEDEASDPEDSFTQSLSMLEQAINNRGDLSVEKIDPPVDQTVATMEAQPVSVLPDPPQANVPTPVSVETDAERASADDAGLGTDPLGDGLATGAPQPPSLTDRIEVAAREIGAALDEMGDARASELGSMIRLALVEAIHPGAFEAVYGPLEEGAGSAGLTTDELALVQTALELSTALHDELDADFIDTDRVGALLEDTLDRIRPQRLLEITDARLCLRVDNFGVYREIERHDDRYKFIAGRAHPAIVYCELDQFTRASTNRDGVDGYIVNVRQALEIYRIGTEDARDTESTLVWRLEPQPVVDFSRRQLRDFFVVQVIELPETLSVGSYRMKIIATDVASGELVERAIEFDIVAHRNAMRGQNFDPNEPGVYNPNR